MDKTFGVVKNSKRMNLDASEGWRILLVPPPFRIRFFRGVEDVGNKVLLHLRTRLRRDAAVPGADR